MKKQAKFDRAVRVAVSAHKRSVGVLNPTWITEKAAHRPPFSPCGDARRIRY